MVCFCTLSIFLIIIFILLNVYFNSSNQNNQKINIVLIIVLFIILCFSLFNKKSENLENTEQEEIKFYDEDKEMIKGLFNNDQIIIDNLTIDTIESPDLLNLMYPIGTTILLYDLKTPKDLKLPGEWQKLEGGRLLTTTGKIEILKSKAWVEYQTMSKTNSDIKYPRYKYDVSSNKLTMGNMEKSDKTGEELGEYKVELKGNNILNHKHPVWVDFCRNSRGKGDSQHAFALMGGSNKNDNNCVDKGSGCHYEPYPSRKTFIYEGNQRIEQTDNNVKPHNNVPKYILVFAYRRIK